MAAKGVGIVMWASLAAAGATAGQLDVPAHTTRHCIRIGPGSPTGMAAFVSPNGMVACWLKCSGWQPLGKPLLEQEREL